MTSVSSCSFVTSFNPSQIANRLVSSGDQNGDAALSFSEFSALGDNTSSDATSNSTSSQRMTDLFNAIDADSDGSLTASEFTEFAQKLANEMTAVMLQVQEQSASASASRNAASDDSSQSNSSDPLDTNKDGVISIMERLAASQNNSAEQDFTMNQLKFMIALESYRTTTTTLVSSAASALSLQT